MHFCHEELAAMFTVLATVTYAWNWAGHLLRNTRVYYLLPVALFSLFVNGCAAEVTKRDAAGVEDAFASGEDASQTFADAPQDDAAVILDDAFSSPFPPCPGLMSAPILYQDESNTCLGTLVNFQSILFYQENPRTCTWTGMLAVEWCDSGRPTQIFTLTGDWEPIGPGQRGVRFSFMCGVRYDCSLTMTVDTPGQADMRCTGARETCSIHLVQR